MDTRRQAFVMNYKFQYHYYPLLPALTVLLVNGIERSQVPPNCLGVRTNTALSKTLVTKFV